MGQAYQPVGLADELIDAQNDATRSVGDGFVLRLAVDSTRDGCAILAHPYDGQPPSFVYVNPAFANLLDDASKRAFQELLVTEVAEAVPVPLASMATDSPVRKNIEEACRTEGVFVAKFELRDHDGSRRFFHLLSEPMDDRPGTANYRGFHLRDITSEVSLEEALRANKRLASIGLLAAGIAHEINNPAGSALLAAETALAVIDTPESRDRVVACLRNIVTSMDRCGRIVRTLLRYSREEPTERQACSINDVARQSLELALPYAERYSVGLRLELDLEVPLAPMNPLEIELVLVNLIRNAVEASLEQRNDGIVIRTAKTDHSVRAAVVDHGCGMNQEQLKHAFDPLYTTRRDRGGSGLGMGIAQGIVLGHAGRMNIESQLGCGTTVTVELPLAGKPL
jgi:signal transduction histidine kinase